MKIAVIDGQGGGIGKNIIERIRKEFSDEVEIIALGTNALATSIMMKAGASEGATGENAIVYTASKVDVIAGPIGIVLANSMLGELTPKIAEAIASSKAQKVLLPVNKCNVHIVDVYSESLPQQIDKLVNVIREIKKKQY